MEKKLVKIGNSVGIVLPKNLLEQMKLKEGSMISMDVDKKQGRVTLDFPTHLRDGNNIVNLEVYKAAKGLLKRYKSAFIELANK